MVARYKVALVGLQRSGKSVFLTSLVNRLVDSHTALNQTDYFLSRNLEVVGLLSDRKLGNTPWRRLKKSCSATYRRLRHPEENLNEKPWVWFRPFPYGVYRNLLTRNPPEWPQKTFDCYGCVLNVKYKWRSHTKHFILEIADYPGEYLADFPMVRKTFAEWSTSQLDLTQKDAPVYDIRSQMGLAWSKRLNSLTSGPNITQQQRADLLASYEEYQIACYERGLEDISPASIVLKFHHDGLKQTAEEGASSDVAASQGVLKLNSGVTRDANMHLRQLAFCPLPEEWKTSTSQGRRELYMAFEKAYKSYVADIVKPLHNVVSCSDVLLVLVDILRCLNRGVQSYNSLKPLGMSVWETLRYCGSRGLFGRRFRKANRIKKALFLGTKGDLVKERDQRALRALTEQMCSSWGHYMSIGLDTKTAIQFMVIAANRATKCVKANASDECLEANVELNEQGQSIFKPGHCFKPPDVPSKWPASWHSGENDFTTPKVLPKSLPEREDAMIPSINMPEVLAHIISECIPGLSAPK